MFMLQLLNPMLTRQPTTNWLKLNRRSLMQLMLNKPHKLLMTKLQLNLTTLKKMPMLNKQLMIMLKNH